MSNISTLSKKDFMSDQEVRWCPGCGDYAILSALQYTASQIGIPKEDICFISGIGCSSRLPYYMNTFGMHTIHGRPIAIASGLKLHNPKLSVWVATGDGDALSIGGNHFIHAIRRNININIIIFNNEIYGLTKGQYSPTSKQGIVSKSSPYGTFEYPFSPAQLSIGSGATFFARTIDNDQKHMREVFSRAEAHNGISVVEVLQNCVIFNDKTHEIFSNKRSRDETTIRVEHGKPMKFGKFQDKGIILDGNHAKAKVVTIGKGGVSENQLLVHDEKRSSPFFANFLSSFKYPNQPLPLGIFRDIAEKTYEEAFYQQVADVKKAKGEGEIEKLLLSSETWVVE